MKKTWELGQLVGLVETYGKEKTGIIVALSSEETSGRIAVQIKGYRFAYLFHPNELYFSPRRRWSGLSRWER